MHVSRPHPISLLLALVGLVAAAACGSSTTTTSAGPTPVRCGVQVTPEDGSFAPEGGTSRVVVAAARECQWTASSEAEWITLTPPVTGQGEGQVQYTVRANAVPVARRGTIAVEAQRVEITQEAGACSYELGQAPGELPATGGTGTVEVRTHAVCPWSTSSGAPWISITAGASGTGPGSVRFAAAPNTGPARSAALTVAGRAIEVRQAGVESPAPPQPPTPDPTPPPTPGPGPTPPPACTFAVGPETHAFAAAEGTGTIEVTTESGCRWTAQSEAAWIILTSAAEQQGSGQTRFRVDANSGAARTGRLLVAGRTVTVTQAAAANDPPPVDPPPQPPCEYSIASTSRTVGASGDTGSVAVQTTSGCSWSASSLVPWIAITGGGTGSGAGEVHYEVAPNESPSAREGQLTIAGQTFTIVQDGTPAGVTIRGEVSSLTGACPALSFTLGEVRVRTSDTTEFVRGTCRQVTEAVTVEVTGQREPDGVVLASRVDLVRGQAVTEGQ